MKPRSYRLENLLTHEVRELVPDHINRVIVPCGATEAHGAIGLGTDTIIPDGLAEKIAPQLDALIAPAVPFGVLRTLSRYPGSLTLSRELYIELMSEIAEGLIFTGFEQIVFLDGHAGNINGLKEVALSMYQQYGIQALVYDWYFEDSGESSEPYDDFGGHSAAGETGLVRAIRPEAAPEGLWREEDAGVPNRAVSAYPAPYPIMLDREGAGLPDFDDVKAKKFFDQVAAKTVESLKTVFQRWDELL